MHKIFHNVETEKQIDYFHFKYPAIIKKILDYLKIGLSDRINLLTPFSSNELSWQVGESANQHNNIITIGIQLNPFNLYKVIEKGPETYDPSAKEFREFWGDQAQLRRYLKYII